MSSLLAVIVVCLVPSEVKLEQVSKGVKCSAVKFEWSYRLDMYNIVLELTLSSIHGGRAGKW